MSAADEIAADARRVAAFPTVAVDLVVRTVAAAVRPRLVADTGGDRVLSGAGGRLSVVTSVDRGARFKVAGRVAAGPNRLRGQWRWLNDGVRPHPNSDHPGTPARSTWDQPVSVAVPQALAAVDARFRVVLE